METAFSFINSFIWRELQPNSINDFLAVCKCSRLYVNFHVATFQVHIRLVANFEISTRATNESRLNFYRF